MRSVFGRALTVLVVAVPFAACSSGSGAYPASSPGAPTPMPSSSTTPSTASSTVEIVGQRGSQSFTPNPATVPSVQTVAWHNGDTVIHRIVANDGSFDTGNLAPGATSTPRALTTDGVNYHCTIHPDMVGAINSSEGTPPPCSGPYCDPNADY